MKIKLTLLSAALAAISLGSASASVLVDIPFNYSGGLPQTVQNIAGTSVSATGVTGNFTNAATVGSLTAGSALSYTVSGGGTIAAGTSGLALTGATNTSIAYSTAITGQTIYARFLYNTSVLTNRMILSLGNSGSVNAPATSGTPRFDLNLAAIAIDVTGNGNNASPTFTFAANTTYLVVARVNWSGTAYTTMNLWVNPAYNGGVAPTPYASATSPVGTATSLTSMDFRSLTATGTMSIDNFAIGTTWADVVVVPEPATWALLAFSLTSVMILRRSRQS